MSVIAYKLMWIALMKCTLMSDNVDTVWICQEKVIKEYFPKRKTK